MFRSIFGLGKKNASKAAAAPAQPKAGDDQPANAPVTPADEPQPAKDAAKPQSPPSPAPEASQTTPANGHAAAASSAPPAAATKEPAETEPATPAAPQTPAASEPAEASTATPATPEPSPAAEPAAVMVEPAAPTKSEPADAATTPKDPEPISPEPTAQAQAAKPTSPVEEEIVPEAESKADPDITTETKIDDAAAADAPGSQSSAPAADAGPIRIERPDWTIHYPPTADKEINPDQYRSMNDLLDQAIAKHADRPAIALDEMEFSFAAIGHQAQRLSVFLRQEFALEKGDRVAAMMPNLPHFAVTTVGVWRAGGTQVNVNPLYTPHELRHQLNDSGATVLIIADLVLQSFAAIAHETNVRHLIVVQTGVVAPDDIVIPEGVSGFMFSQAIELGEGDLPPVPLGPDDVAVLQYTGGTTGVAKGAALTHRNLIANLMQSETVIRSEVDRDETPCIVTALPLYHIFALTVNFLLFFHLGIKNVFVPNPRDLQSFAAAFKRNRITVITGVNTLYQSILFAPEFADVDLTQVTFAIGGGAAVQQAVSERWQERSGRHIVEGYGLSETSPVLTINKADGAEFNGSIGVPAPSTDLSIRDDDNNEMPLGESGEICAKGPQVMRGYWNRPEATAEVMTADGYFRTGDVGYMDNDGFLYINDRKKDMILVSGFNVFPNEVEAAIALLDGVVESAVVSVPDDKTGEGVVAFIVADREMSAEDVMNHCRNELAPYKCPRRVTFLEALPKSTVGKILRRELRDQAAAGA